MGTEHMTSTTPLRRIAVSALVVVALALGGCAAAAALALGRRGGGDCGGDAETGISRVTATT